MFSQTYFENLSIENLSNLAIYKIVKIRYCAGIIPGMILQLYYFLVEGKFRKMLHEILFALLGHTGSIIIELPLIEQ